MSSDATMDPVTDGAPTVVIEARPESTSARLRELWRYRSFYGFLFKELMTRRTRGTMLGIWWLVLRQLLPVVIMIFTFSSVNPVETPNGVAYPMFFLSGYVTWLLFQRALTYLPRALTWTQSIMKRTYFPRLLVPLSGFAPALIDFAILVVATLVVAGVMTWQTGQVPFRGGLPMLGFIPAVVLSLAFALAIGIPTGVAALFFRDVRFAVRYVSQLFMFVTPVVYPVTFIPEQYRWIMYTLNPMAAVIELSRWSLTGAGEIHPGFLALSTVTILSLLAASIAFFLRAEVHLGDQL